MSGTEKYEIQSNFNIHFFHGTLLTANFRAFFGGKWSKKEENQYFNPFLSRDSRNSVLQFQKV
jgi:hypothetical protein